MDNYSEQTQKSLSELEEKIDRKFKTLFRYKTIQISLKMIIFTALACLLFFRSGKTHDFYMWFIGLFMLFLALGEFIELEEAKQNYKETGKEEIK